MLESLGLNRVGGTRRGEFNDETTEKGLSSVPVIFYGGEEDYLWIRGGHGEGHSMMITPLKGLRSVPNVLYIFPIIDSLVSFVMIILTNELCPLMLSHP